MPDLNETVLQKLRRELEDALDSGDDAELARIRLDADDVRESALKRGAKEQAEEAGAIAFAAGQERVDARTGDASGGLGGKVRI